VHDIDTLRFLLDDEPVEVSAMTSAGTMSTAGLADGVMAIVRFRNGVLAQLHDAFTVPYAPTGLEIHGSAGSLFARDVMTQRPAGEITLRSAEGTREIDVEHRDLYRVAVAQFHRSLSDDQEPAATGIDGYRSLVAALSLVKSAEAGGHVTVPSRFAE
jgi:1,5-anhydro-D-fructose reductase (1,5-anhydro-D-mannitol-forming)